MIYKLLKFNMLHRYPTLILYVNIYLVCSIGRRKNMMQPTLKGCMKKPRIEEIFQPIVDPEFKRFLMNRLSRFILSPLKRFHKSWLEEFLMSRLDPIILFITI